MGIAIARFGPIEVGRVTTLGGPAPFFVTINAVAAKLPYFREPELCRSFTDYYEARDYAISYFPPDRWQYIEWQIFP
jgi:hypothetical protein